MNIPHKHKRTKTYTGIHNVAVGIRQSLDGRNNDGDTRRHTPGHNLALFGGVDQTHAVQRRERVVEPSCPVLARYQGEGAFDHQRTELLLKAFVSLDISKPEAG